MENELLLCPFCGEMPDDIIINFHHKFECVNDDCPQSDSWAYSTKEKAIAAWNTRPQLAARDAVIEECELILKVVRNNNPDSEWVKKTLAKIEALKSHPQPES